MRTTIYLHGEDASSLVHESQVLLGEASDTVKIMRLDMAELTQIHIATQTRSLFGAMQYRVALRNVQSATAKQSLALLQLLAEKRPELQLILCAPYVKYNKDLHKKLLKHPDVEVREFKNKTGSFFRQWLQQEIKTRQLQLHPDAIDWLSQHLDGMQSQCLQLLDHLRLYQGDEKQELNLTTVAALCGEERTEDIRSYCHAMLRRSSDALLILHKLLNKQAVSAIQISVWLANALHSMLMYQQLLHQTSSYQAARQAHIFHSDDKKNYANQYKNWSAAQLAAALYALTELEYQLKGSSVESDLLLMQSLTLKILRL